MECNQKIVIANKMKKLRDEILDITKEKERFVDSPAALRVLEGFILRKQSSITLLHLEYNLID